MSKDVIFQLKCNPIYNFNNNLNKMHAHNKCLVFIFLVPTVNAACMRMLFQSNSTSVNHRRDAVLNARNCALLSLLCLFIESKS